jgi:phage terminase large subunit-like protein
LHAAIVDREITHDGAARMREHFHNARRRPNQFGVGVGKEHRESKRKIDAVPAAVLARLARQEYLALPPSRQRRKRTGKAVFF